MNDGIHHYSQCYQIFVSDVLVFEFANGDWLATRARTLNRFTDDTQLHLPRFSHQLISVYLLHHVGFHF